MFKKQPTQLAMDNTTVATGLNNKGFAFTITEQKAFTRKC